MLCQCCGKRTATTHIKAVVNGKLTQYHLCASCAKEQGYTDLFNGWGFNSLLGSVLEAGNRENATEERCPVCGASFQELSQTGKIGCAECYHTFRRQLLPVIQRIHGTAHHKGKVPGSSALRISDLNHTIVPVVKGSLEEKKRLLKKAVEAQDYEQAAVLRDEIKEMESHG